MIQRTVISELNKLAIIHLYANGYTGEDLLNFTLRLSNPSTIAQQQKLEIHRAKFEIAGSAPEGLVSRPYILRNILMLNDDEIKAIDREQEEDAQRAAIIAAAAELVKGGGGGGGADLSGGPGGPPGGDIGGPPGGEGDIFAASPGGEEGGAPAPEPEGGVEPPEENAADEPLEDEPDLELLTSADDPDDKPSHKLRRGEVPVKPSPLVKALYDRSRRRTHGSSTTHMPDFSRMMDFTQPQDSDVDGMANLSRELRNPFGESVEERSPGRVVPRDVRNMLEMMGKRLGIDHSNVLLEDVDAASDIDIDIEDDEDVI